MDNRSIGEQVTDEIINEQFPTRQMQIDHLKEISETIKSNPDLKETIKNELSSNPTNQTKEDKKNNLPPHNTDMSYKHKRAKY